MSGHSKWSSIKHKKGAADAKRGKLFSKLSRAIIVAAREGGGDPAATSRSQNAIEKARSYSMPKDNIERAIARGAGTDADADAYETVVYEGYGPSGVAVLVEALTDNRNRTAADVRHLRQERRQPRRVRRGRLALRAHGRVLVDADARRRGRADAGRGRRRGGGRRAGRLELRSRAPRTCSGAGGARGGGDHGRVRRGDDGAEDDRRGRGRGAAKKICA